MSSAAPARPSGTGPSRFPRRIVVLLHLAAAAAWFGVFAIYVRVWLGPSEASGVLEQSARQVVEGRAQAPFQYRLLVPHVLMGLHDALGWPVGYAEAVVDVAALAVGVAVIAALLRRLDLEHLVVPVALVGAYLEVGTLWFGKFETATAFAATTIAAWALVTDDRRRWLALAPAMVVLAGTRTDLLLALAIGAAARWLLAGRRRTDLVTAAALAIAGIGASIALAAAYPDAHYDPGAPMVQVAHNLNPLVLLVVALFVLPVLGPFLLVRSEPALRTLLDAQRDLMAPLLGMVIAELGSVLIVGRADEVRLLFPLAAPLGIVAVLGWRALVGAHLVTPDPTPSAVDADAVVEGPPERGATPAPVLVGMAADPARL